MTQRQIVNASKEDIIRALYPEEQWANFGISNDKNTIKDDDVDEDSIKDDIEELKHDIEDINVSHLKSQFELLKHVDRLEKIILEEKSYRVQYGNSIEWIKNELKQIPEQFKKNVQNESNESISMLKARIEFLEKELQINYIEKEFFLRSIFNCQNSESAFKIAKDLYVKEKEASRKGKSFVAPNNNPATEVAVKTPSNPIQEVVCEKSKYCGCKQCSLMYKHKYDTVPTDTKIITNKNAY